MTFPSRGPISVAQKVTPLHWSEDKKAKENMFGNIGRKKSKNFKKEKIKNFLANFGPE